MLIVIKTKYLQFFLFLIRGETLPRNLLYHSLLLYWHYRLYVCIHRDLCEYLLFSMREATPI